MRYDPFQQKSIDLINKGHSVIVSAPTGAGKTAIAEHVIEDCIKNDTKVIYTAPVKALSNQKFRDFQEIYPELTGILTGDVSINPHAPILIMTTEIFRNKILTEPDSLDDYSWIIFDEIHYIDDLERGTVWEESLIFMPRHMKLLALSATIPNIDEFAEWITSVHKRSVKTVVEKSRPVPLHLFYQCEGQFFDSLKKLRPFQARGKKKYYYKRGRRYSKKRKTRPNRLDTLIKHLERNSRLPCIYFAFGRRRCEYLAEEMGSFDFLTFEERGRILEMYEDLCERFDLTGEKSAVLLRPLVERGIAFHHAGMLPTLKEVVERLFTSRLIKVIFTTETFALGINMPARTVVFDELRKFYGSFFADLRTRDFYQMAGRAGRRGIDREGFVYSRVNLHRTGLNEIYSMIKGKPEKVKSRFNACYATLLTLYELYGEDLYDIYPLSYHYFQQKKRSRRRALEDMTNKVNLLKELGYIEDGGITQKGEFAAKVYGYELPLTELYDSGVLESLSETELAVLCAALVYEPRKGTAMPRLNKPAKRLRARTEKLLGYIHRLERGYRIKPPCKDYRFHLSPVVEMWVRGSSFEEIMSHSPADEGSLIRYFRMTVQILREMLDTHASTEFKDKVRRTIRGMNRDIVDAENQLRV
jgi:superfamily II RNA helicase